MPGFNCLADATVSRDNLRSLAEYDDFYAIVERVFADLERRFSRFVQHTHNHRQDHKPLPADPRYNPEVNLGTGTLDRNLGTSCGAFS